MTQPVANDKEALVAGLQAIVDGHAARRRQARINSLPADVKAGILTLTEQEQDQYLASLEKAAQMAETGETFTPDLGRSEEVAEEPRRRRHVPKTVDPVGR